MTPIRGLTLVTISLFQLGLLIGNVTALPAGRSLLKRGKLCRPHAPAANATWQDNQNQYGQQSNTATPVVAIVPSPSPTPSAAPSPPPEPTPSWTPAPSEQAQPEVTQTSTGGQTPSTPAGGSAGPFHGEGTFYAPGQGACGPVHSAQDAVVAVSHLLYDTFPGATANSNLNPICGRNVKVTWKGGVAKGIVVDRCEGCAYGDIDMSPNLWQQLGADPAIGRLSDNVMGSDGKPTVSVDWVWE